MKSCEVPISLLLVFLLALSPVDLSTARQDFDFFYFVLQWPGAYCDTRRSCCYPTTGKPAADFGIHGLWPNYNDGSYPSNCDPDSPFDASKITDIIKSEQWEQVKCSKLDGGLGITDLHHLNSGLVLKQTFFLCQVMQFDEVPHWHLSITKKKKITDIIRRMQAEWPTLACPSGDGLTFWEHEWEKHGTCSESVLDQRHYFQTALDLKDKLDLLAVLKGAGIEPDGGYYSLSSISGAIKAATGFTPGIECNVDEARNSQLYQVYLCVDSSASGFIECPKLPRRKCSSRIEFPAF